ncbi:MAG: 23S rRNA (uracil(747)-C(5))-methyltransferase RlmC [Nocardioides sp.]
MQCAYYDAAACRSCSELPTPYAEQLARKEMSCRAILGAYAERPGLTWLPVVASHERAFRNKAKMVVAGPVGAPTLGILDPRGSGTDLRGCPLYSAAMHEILEVLAGHVTRAGLTPYDVRTRRGELKHLLVTESPDGEFLVRWVLRSSEALPRIRKHLDALLAEDPRIAVVSVNFQPDHKAVLEGEHETVLTTRETLPMRVNDVVLHLRPRSFFQTNTAVAEALYRRAATWADRVAPASVLDLYCGVGGFALHLAAPGRDVSGVEVSDEAVASAVLSAHEAGLVADFWCGDAATADLGAELVVVNPPRRGIGPDLAVRLDASEAQHLIYSSCSAASLARDLSAMPSWRPVEAQLLDMFAHTTHYEVAMLLERC